MQQKQGQSNSTEEQTLKQADPDVTAEQDSPKSGLQAYCKDNPSAPECLIYEE